MAKALYKEGFDTDAIHGDLRQNKRTTVIKNFRSGKIQVLVATDVAARGLDIPNIEHVCCLFSLDWLSSISNR